MALTTVAAEVMRDYDLDGVPSSGVHQPKKSDIRRLLGGYERVIDAFTSSGGLVFDTRALLYADLAKTANVMAWVVNDATAAYNGIYKKVGASGTGSWERVADLPYSFVVASDTGAGTPNAIQAATSNPISGSVLVLLNIFQANTASPVTVSFNGGSTLTVKTNNGNDVASGGLVAGMQVLGRVSGSTFRLASDQVPSAIIAQAEAAAAQAVAAAASLDLPTISAGDAGKTLFVNGSGGGYDLAKVSEGAVTSDAEDPLRITISNLSYPKGLDRSGDNAAASSNTAAINLAASSKKYVELGEGEITVNSIQVSSGNRKLIGYGRGATRLLGRSSTLPMIDFANGLEQCAVKDLTLARTVTPSAGTAAGIRTGAAVNLFEFDNLYIFGNWDGFLLFNTGYSHIRGCFCDANLSDGIQMANSGNNNQLQWYIDDILLQKNGERGIFASSAAGPSGVALGDWTNIRSFANSGPAIAVVGTSGVPINGVRLRGGFVGEDGGAAEIYLDTYGFGHKIENMFVEIPGTRTTGPTFGTPATGTGYGVQATVNNQDLKIADCYVYGCPSGGVISSATVLTRVSDTAFKNNGPYGVIIADGSKYAESDCDFSGHTTAARIVTSNLASALISGATPASTQPTQIPGGVAVGNPTGGVPGAGLVNVSSGLLKNNTAYTNP